ncbi:hypothetical protein HDU99_005489, partial [Rhizoclosmatium hyalinum]
MSTPAPSPSPNAADAVEASSVFEGHSEADVKYEYESDDNPSIQTPDPANRENNSDVVNIGIEEPEGNEVPRRSAARINRVPSEPPPEYDGHRPPGMILLETVTMRIDSQPNFFKTSCPTILHHIISPEKYESKMRELNELLSSPESIKSIWLLRYYGPFVIITAVVCIVSATAVFIYAHDRLWAGFSLVIIPLIAYGLMPSVEISAKYVGVVDAFVRRFNKSCHDENINLFFTLQKRKANVLSTFINVKI